MHFPMYFLCASLLVAAVAKATEEEANTDTRFFNPRRIQGAHDNSPKEETLNLNFLLPRFVPKYRPLSRWNDNADFDFIVNEIDGNNIEQDPGVGSEERFKRAGPSLSIVNPLDVLRQRLLLEMARRQMRESSRQVEENRKLMKAIGKRGSFLRQDTPLRGNPIGFDTM